MLEAGFAAERALAFADVMLPVLRRKGLEWRMVEVKSSTSVKDTDQNDIAIQSLATGRPVYAWLPSP